MQHPDTLPYSSVRQKDKIPLDLYLDCIAFIDTRFAIVHKKQELPGGVHSVQTHA